MTIQGSKSRARKKTLVGRLAAVAEPNESFAETQILESITLQFGTVPGFWIPAIVGRYPTGYLSLTDTHTGDVHRVYFDLKLPRGRVVDLFLCKERIQTVILNELNKRLEEPRRLALTGASVYHEIELGGSKAWVQGAERSFTLNPVSQLYMGEPEGLSFQLHRFAVTRGLEVAVPTNGDQGSRHFPFLDLTISVAPEDRDDRPWPRNVIELDIWAQQLDGNPHPDHRNPNKELEYPYDCLGITGLVGPYSEPLFFLAQLEEAIRRNPLALDSDLLGKRLILGINSPYHGRFEHSFTITHEECDKVRGKRFTEPTR